MKNENSLSLDCEVKKMSIVLFAMIGAAIKAGVAYWICYGIYCTIAILKLLINLAENN